MRLELFYVNSLITLCLYVWSCKLHTVDVEQDLWGVCGTYCMFMNMRKQDQNSIISSFLHSSSALQP